VSEPDQCDDDPGRVIRRARLRPGDGRFSGDGGVRAVRRGWVRRLAPGLFCCLLLGCGEQDALVPPGSRTVNGFRGVAVGEPLLLGLWIVDIRENRPVRFIDARVRGIPRGLVVDHVWALRFSQAGNEMVGALRGDAQLSRLRPFLHPVGDVALDPACPPQEHCGERTGEGDRAGRLQDWYLVAQCHTGMPGDLRAGGLEITYAVNRDTRTQTLDQIGIEVDSGAGG
jgi:hypothetical protein